MNPYLSINHLISVPVHAAQIRCGDGISNGRKERLKQRERRKSIQRMPKCDLIRTSTRLVPQIFDEREVLSILGPGKSVL